MRFLKHLEINIKILKIVTLKIITMIVLKMEIWFYAHMHIHRTEVVTTMSCSPQAGSTIFAMDSNVSEITK